MTVKILPHMSLVFFLHLQNAGKFFATPRRESLAPVKTKDTENTGRFGKSWKKVIPRKALFFLHSTGMNRSI